MEQVVQLVCSRINDAKSVATEMIGIESANEDTNHGTQCQPQWRKAIVRFHDFLILFPFCFNFQFS